MYNTQDNITENERGLIVVRMLVPSASTVLAPYSTSKDVRFKALAADLSKLLLAGYGDRMCECAPKTVILDPEGAVSRPNPKSNLPARQCSSSRNRAHTLHKPRHSRDKNKTFDTAVLPHCPSMLLGQARAISSAACAPLVGKHGDPRRSLVSTLLTVKTCSSPYRQHLLEVQLKVFRLSLSKVRIRVLEVPREATATEGSKQGGVSIIFQEKYRSLSINQATAV